MAQKNDLSPDALAEMEELGAAHNGMVGGDYSSLVRHTGAAQDPFPKAWRRALNPSEYPPVVTRAR